MGLKWLLRRFKYDAVENAVDGAHLCFEGRDILSM